MANTKQTQGKTQRPVRRSRHLEEPLDVRLSFTVRTGDEPEDTLVVLDNREITMAKNVFAYRDRAARFLAFTLVRVAATNRKVMNEVVPALRLLNHRKR